MSTIHIYHNLLPQLDKLFLHSRQCSHKTRTRYREAIAKSNAASGGELNPKRFKRRI